MACWQIESDACSLNQAGQRGGGGDCGGAGTDAGRDDGCWTNPRFWSCSVAISWRIEPCW